MKIKNQILEKNNSLRKRELENQNRTSTAKVEDATWLGVDAWNPFIFATFDDIILDDVSAKKKEIREFMKNEYIDDDELQKCKEMLQELRDFEKKVKFDRVKIIIFLLSVLIVIALVIYRLFF